MNSFESIPEAASGTYMNDDNEILRDHYSVFGIEKNASQQDVREAYFRLKNTYNQSNQALYSLIDDQEVQDSLAEIRSAYDVLCDPDKRYQYDLTLLNRGLVKSEELSAELHETRAHRLGSHKEHMSAESLREKDSRRQCAVTGDSQLRQSGAAETERHRRNLCSDRRGSVQNLTSDHDAAKGKVQDETDSRRGLPAKVRDLVAPQARLLAVQQKVHEAIEAGDPSDGAFYEKIRELVGVSREEMQNHIKISIGYIKNLEENCFDLLPQEVYIKGFLKSYLRFLGVHESDQLVTAYVERYHHWAISRDSWNSK